MIVPFAGACSGALSKATCESATTIAGTTTKAMQISFEEIPASRPAEVTSNCTTYLEPERRGWPAAGGLGATGVAQQKKANVRGSTTGCSHRTRSPIVKGPINSPRRLRRWSSRRLDPHNSSLAGSHSRTRGILSQRCLQPHSFQMVYAITSSVLTGFVGSSLVMTGSEVIGTFSGAW